MLKKKKNLNHSRENAADVPPSPIYSPSLSDVRRRRLSVTILIPSPSSSLDLPSSLPGCCQLRSFKFDSSIAAAHPSSIFRSSRRSSWSPWRRSLHMPSFFALLLFPDVIPRVVARRCSPRLLCFWFVVAETTVILDRGFRVLMESYVEREDRDRYSSSL
ncbi:hypothetical protein PIB30_089350 [Stylosanthes scabra]|uniref:Uncharacterized protein n=1 Tax=Stylosanthes scabra TaxID=79078 RepID=A0ABU6VSE3_9FABA|nr:hypothetical protein [Stylosanthes scabra]